MTEVLNELWPTFSTLMQKERAVMDMLRNKKKMSVRIESDRGRDQNKETWDSEEVQALVCM